MRDDICEGKQIYNVSERISPSNAPPLLLCPAGGKSSGEPCAVRATDTARCLQRFCRGKGCVPSLFFLELLRLDRPRCRTRRACLQCARAGMPCFFVAKRGGDWWGVEAWGASGLQSSRDHHPPPLPRSPLYDEPAAALPPPPPLRPSCASSLLRLLRNPTPWQTMMHVVDECGCTTDDDDGCCCRRLFGLAPC